MEKRLLVFGDMHGEYEKLMSLWEKVKFNSQTDKLIFLGDYIDRGPEPLNCLDFIIDKVEKFNAIALMGNHEYMMLNDQNMWIFNGGKTTARKLRKVSEEKQALYIKFCANLPIYYEQDNMIFMHAGLNPSIQDWKEDTISMIWIRGEFLNGYKGEKTVFVGHTPVQACGFNDVTKLKNNIVMCDTGSYLSDGFISCVDAYTMKIWHS